MMGWWWNEVYFRTKGLALNQKYPSFHPHSVIPSSFLNDETDWNEVRMSRMTTEWYPSIVIFIPCHFLAFWNDQGMTEWGGMMVFLEVDKNTEFWDTSHPATIRSFQPHSFVEWCQNDWNGLGMLSFYHSILEHKQSNWESKGEAEGSSFRFRYFKKRKLDPSASLLDQSHSTLILLIPLSFHLEWWSKGEAEGSCLCLFKSHSTLICLIPISFHLDWWSKGEAEGSSLRL